jgi:deazaflavin-dependent oxidoreductase (nitroreductase family)
VTISPLNRWLYRGRRPNWIARVLNGLGAAVASTGATAKVGMVTLDVVGRRSGQTISLPVAVVVVNGERYLVSMLGEDVQWVKNVRAAGGRAALRSGGRERIVLEDVPAERRAPILRAYLQRAPGARPHVPVEKDAPLADFERVASAYPVFRVTSPASE